MARLETWEALQARLFHLGWLGEELPEFVASPAVSAWLFRQIAAEAGVVAAVAAEYVVETERAATRPREDGADSGGGCTGSPARGGDAL